MILPHPYYICDTDNIPDHRSRKFGCCAEQNSIKWLT